MPVPQRGQCPTPAYQFHFAISISFDPLAFVEFCTSGGEAGFDVAPDPRQPGAPPPPREVLHRPLSMPARQHLRIRRELNFVRVRRKGETKGETERVFIRCPLSILLRLRIRICRELN